MAITSSQIDTLTLNCITAFFDDTSNNRAGMPRIIPASSAGSTFGLKDNSQTVGPWWMSADMLRFMVERCRAFPGDSQMITRVKQQAAFYTSQYTEAQLQSDGSADGTIGASDDACWKMLSFCDLHRITGDAAWLNRAVAALPKVLNRFKDPYHPQVVQENGVSWSPYGILYTLPSDPGGPQNIASMYEPGLALAALYIYEQTGMQGFLHYATGMAQRWLNSSSASDSTVGFQNVTGPGFQDVNENPGAFFAEMNLSADPVQPYIRFAPPKDPADGKDHPFRNGGGPHMLQACFGVGTVCAKLYRIQKDSSWLPPIKTIMSALASSSIYLTTSGKFLNDRDPYEVGFWACDFVREALSLRSEGVDPGDVVRNGFIATAQYILANPVSGTSPDTNTYYSADWGIPTDYRNGSTVNGTSSWTQNGTNNPGDQAIPQQIMTTSMSGMMAMAGYLCGTLTGDVLTDGGSTLTDGGQTLVDA